MSLCPSIIPESKKFFKIPELAGKRWPNVTEDNIYEWHDSNIQLPVITEWEGNIIRLVETTKGLNDISKVNLWYDPPHFGKINLVGYWVFFPEFDSWTGGIDLEEPSTDDNTSTWRERIKDKWPNLLNAEPLGNSYMLLDTKDTTGFAFNKAGIVKLPLVFDERGIVRFPATYDHENVDFIPTLIEVHKEDLLIKASSVRLLEKIVPEITGTKFPAKTVNAEDTLCISPGSNLTRKEAITQNASKNRIERTNLSIIAVLLDAVKSNLKLDSNTQIIDHILDEYRDIPNLKQRTLEGRFSAATKELLSVRD